MREVFAEHRPTVVFHAAAYKHVGLMEANPVEAVRNNAIATRAVARVAGESGTRSSSSRRTRPWPRDGHGRVGCRSPNGRSPRRTFGSWGRNNAWGVRFGNVLGSRALGRPDLPPADRAGRSVTVTDERMTRFFMTIPEAVQLIIRAGSLGEGGRCSYSTWASR